PVVAPEHGASGGDGHVHPHLRRPVDDVAMTALMILTYDVTDADRLGWYRDAAAPVLLGPDRGELVLSTDRTVHLPEASSNGTHTVVLRFASAERAREIYESPEYQDVLAGRLAATVPSVAMIVDEAS
ncbi:MAG: DUF1330 domain-containing protein, partial [Dermatophilaceae bacterium]